MDSAVAAGLIGAGAALVGTVGGTFGGFWTAKKQREAALETLGRQLKAERDAQQRQARITFRERQLNELYGPMYGERERSRQLRSRLPEWEDEERRIRWRLVDHIADAKQDPDWRAICEKILRSGDTVVDLLTSRSGLLEPLLPPFGAFSKFILHHEQLRMSWEAGENQDPQNRFPFPGRTPGDSDHSKCTPAEAANDLDCAIWLGMERVQHDRERLLGIELPG